MNRRDLLLQEMGITQWKLTNPSVLKGDAQIFLSEEIKLLVIANSDHQQSQLFQDILLSLQLSKQNYQWINTEEALRLSFEHKPLIWIIEHDQQAERLKGQFANFSILNTACWKDLSISTNKRQLWQQIEPFSSNN